MGKRNDILSAEHSIKTSDRSGNPPTRKVSFLLLRWDARCSGVVFLDTSSDRWPTGYNRVSVRVTIRGRSTEEGIS